MSTESFSATVMELSPDTLPVPSKPAAKRVNSTGNMRSTSPLPTVRIQPCKTPELHHVDSVPNLRCSSSNFSLDRGLSASPIPWRDASMEVLVSPNDGPQLALEDFDLDSPLEFHKMGCDDDAFDTTSLCDKLRQTSFYGRDDFLPVANPDIDKLIDRKFACYGISPKLHRKSSDSQDVTVLPVPRGQRPKSLGTKLDTNLIIPLTAKERNTKAESENSLLKNSNNRSD